MERGQTAAAHVIAARNFANRSQLQQVYQAGGDGLGSAGDQAGVRSGQGIPLIGVYADAVQPLVGRYFFSAPLPVMPPAPKITSAPWSMACLAVAAPHSGSVKAWDSSPGW